MSFSQLLAPLRRVAHYSAYWNYRTLRCFRLASPVCGSAFQKCVSRSAFTRSVTPFGKMVFAGPGNLNISPMNPQDYPNMDQCILHCVGDESRWSILVEDGVCSIDGAPQETVTDTWSVQVPIKYDIDVRCGGSASVSFMESSRIAVDACDAVTLTGIRTGHVTVQTAGCVIVREALLGNVSFDAREVDAAAARLQGQTVAVRARRRCRLSDVYADTLQLRADTADLLTGTLHARVTASAAGDGELVIGGVDGSLQLEAPDAAVSCHVHRLMADSRIGCGGRLRLTLAPSAACRLEVRGPAPALDERLPPAERGPDGVHLCRVGGGGGPLLRLETVQPADVRLREWAAVAGWS